jgi:chemotaxis protein MotB
MMSLLLTFFILLFSMSELEMEKFLLASQSLREAMGGSSAEAIPDPTGLLPDSVDPALNLQYAEARGTAGSGSLQGTMLDEFADSYLEVIQEKLQGFVNRNELQETVRVEKEEEGVFLRMETGTLFGSAEADLRPDAREILKYLSQVTRDLNVGVVIAGHADNQPILSGSFASNWELSAARAAGVARYLVQDGHPATMVRVESYGEFKPIADNDTPEGRAKNRRVELFYSREDVRSAAIRWSSAGDRPPPARNP